MRTLRLYAFYFLAWTVVGAVYLAQSVARQLYQGSPHPWQNADFWATTVYLSAILTPAVVALGRRWPMEKQSWSRRLALHLVLSLCYALGLVMLGTIVYQFRDHYFPPQIHLRFVDELTLQLIYNFHNGVIGYWVIFSIQSAFRNYARFQERAQEALRLDLRASQLETQITQARLNALKAQLHPHFLFNTLNAIAVLVRQQQGQLAEETLARFSDLLRAVLSDIELQEVPLARELEYARLYLSIEQLRFSDRLQININADAELLDAMVPHMTLQPIVENAVRHGIEARAESGMVQISAIKIDHFLYLEVADNGPGFQPADLDKSNGIGLRNTRARLKQLYGDSGELLTSTRPEGGALVIVKLPFKIEASAEPNTFAKGVSLAN